jgi:hypothetical protein
MSKILENYPQTFLTYPGKPKHHPKLPIWLTVPSFHNAPLYTEALDTVATSLELGQYCTAAFLDAKQALGMRACSPSSRASYLPPVTSLSSPIYLTDTTKYPI